MLTLVQISRDRRSSEATAALLADYLAFDRRRREMRPYLQLFAGFTILVLLGGVAGRVPRVESFEAAAVLIAPVCALLVAHAWRWARLQTRLGAIRAEIKQRGL